MVGAGDSISISCSTLMIGSWHVRVRSVRCINRRGEDAQISFGRILHLSQCVMKTKRILIYTLLRSYKLE